MLINHSSMISNWRHYHISIFDELSKIPVCLNKLNKLRKKIKLLTTMKGISQPRNMTMKITLKITWDAEMHWTDHPKIYAIFSVFLLYWTELDLLDRVKGGINCKNCLGLWILWSRHRVVSLKQWPTIKMISNYPKEIQNYQKQDSIERGRHELKWNAIMYIKKRLTARII